MIFSSEHGPGPLVGIRVIELGQNIAGPFAAQVLTQLGAQVVKIERPDGGDDARGWGPPFSGDTATTFIAVNRGKQSVELDLKTDAGRDELLRIVAGADVLLQNLRPGMLGELGLGSDEIVRRFPALIYCNLGAFGHKGPRSLKPGYEPIIQAFSGLMMMNGDEDGPPTRTGPQILDLGTGMWAVIGILSALHRRTETGRGGVIDVSLLETALGWMGPHFAGFTVTGQPPKRHLSGNPNTVVFQAFQTATTPVMIAAANDRLFVKLCAVLGRPDLGQDARFVSNGLRVTNKSALLAEIEPVLLSRPCGEWILDLDRAGVPCGPIHDMAAMAAEPQVGALGIVEPVQGMPVSAIGVPISFDGLRPRASGGVPAPGQDGRGCFSWADGVAEEVHP